MTILVTGASGFVGQALCQTLLAGGTPVVAAVRRPGSAPAGTEERVVEALGPHTDWRRALEGIDTVVHLAGRAHVMRERESDPLALFRHVNTEGTRALAEQAAGRCRRLVLVSTIKVNGETTAPDRPFRPTDRPDPRDPYGVAKAEAEDALFSIAARHGLEAVVVRPPLIHGPGARGNLATLLRVLRRRVPLPLAAADNRRSLVGVDNMAALLIRAARHPDAAGEIFLARDDEDLSTSALLRRLAAALNRPARLVPVPLPLLRLAASAIGQGAMAARLLDSLVVDDGHTRRRLDWAPPVPLDEGLRRMVGASFKASPFERRPV